MAAKRGACAHCGTTDRSLPAHDMCGKCYDLNYPKETRRQQKPRVSVLVEGTWPRAERITIHHTSDDKEHGSEVEALKWQLDVERARYARVKGLGL